MNNYYNHANIKSPCPNYIDIESLDGRTMPERRSSDDRRISWHPTATGRSPGSHRWTTGWSPSGHRPKFRSSAKWIGWPPSSRLAVAGRRLVLDFYDPVQGRKNPVMICRCLKTGIGGKSGDHCTILKACDAAFNCTILPRDRFRFCEARWDFKVENNHHMENFPLLLLFCGILFHKTFSFYQCPLPTSPFPSFHHFAPLWLAHDTWNY